MSLSRRHAIVAAIGLSLAVVVPAVALQMTKFSAAALAAAQSSGKAVLVEISAPWCPTCKAQKPILEKLLTSDKFKSFITLDIDFDSQKSDVAALKANMQSTLIVYKGSKEVGRSVGDTNAASIEALLAKAL